MALGSPRREEKKENLLLGDDLLGFEDEEE